MSINSGLLPGLPAKIRMQNEASMHFSHATPFPSKGLHREKLDAKRIGEPMVSVSAYLRLRTRKVPCKK